MGLIQYNGAYYYVKKNGQVDVNTSRYFNEEMTKGYFTPGVYYFDAEGKMILKNGVVDGVYYENGSIVKGLGLIQYNGAFYYVKKNGQVDISTTRYFNKDMTKGLIPVGLYAFDETGKMIL